MQYHLWERPDMHVEDIGNPVNDLMQDSWLMSLEYINRRDGSLPKANTIEELKQAYGADAGLIHANFQHARQKMYEKNGAKKRTGGTRLTDSMDAPDYRAARDKQIVEYRDSIEQIVRDQPELITFVDAWTKRDGGESLTAKERKQISRLRSATGLPLVVR